MLRKSAGYLYSANKLCFYKQKTYSCIARVFYSTYDKDFPNPALPTPVSKLYSHDTDILFEQIRRAKTIERLLELSSMHLDVMNAKHIVESMQSIHGFSKDPNFSNTALMENQVFQGLCSRLMKTVRLLEPQEIISVYKVLSSLGIRNNTYVMQSILKMIGSQVNNMSLGQLTFLHFLLSKQKPNSMVDGLKLALPLVLQVQIEQQLDSDNITEIIDCLQLACKARLKPAVIEKVLKGVTKKANLMSASNAVTVVISLLKLDTPVDGYMELLNFSFQILAKNIESLNQKQSIIILRLCHNQNYYDSGFCFALAKKIVQEEWNFEQSYDVVYLFYKLKFAPQYFIDYFVNVMCKESATFGSKLFYSPLNCIEYLTLTGYQPARLQEALELMCSFQEKVSKLTEKSFYLYVKFVCCLTMLGHFPQNYLDKILDENVLFDVWSTSRKQGRSHDFEIVLSTLLWSLHVYDQQEKYKLPPAVVKKLVNVLCQKSEDYQSPLENFIQHGLGGSQFLQNGLFTNEGIYIDHVLAMRSGNYPVSLHPLSQKESPLDKVNSAKFVEDLKLPEDAKVVPIIVAEKDKYCQDPQILKGWMDLKIRCLRKKKYYPVVVNYENFKQMPDREKIPFLMCEIKHAVEDEDITKASSIS